MASCVRSSWRLRSSRPYPCMGGGPTVCGGKSRTLPLHGRYEAPHPPSVVGSIGRLILTLPLQGGGAAGGGGKSRTLPLQGRGGGLLAVAVKQTLPLQGEGGAAGDWRCIIYI